MTTAVQSPFSDASDPSGTELRKALLRADCDVAGLTLMGGVARVAVN